tara:strand:- start:505 stop:1524 length:1020 start_codon:yes stop_codon:yes gene_type:complete
MIVYWGGMLSGNNYLQNLTLYNNKIYAAVRKYRITVRSNDTHFLERNKKYVKWFWDVTKHTQVVHRPVGCDTTVVSNTTRMIEFLWQVPNDTISVRYENGGLTLRNTYYPVHAVLDNQIYRPVKLPNRFYNKTNKQKFMNPEYKDTLMYYDCISNDNKNKLGMLEEVTYNDIPTCDLIFPSIDTKNMSYEGFTPPPEYSEHTNIIPYKSDLVEMARVVLDNVERIKDKSKMTVKDMFELYKENKKELWKYVDRYVFEDHHTIAKKLNKNKIKFEYFNLDKDSYNNRFGFNKVLPRICSHNTYHQLSIAKDVKRARNNYNKLTDMAREYVASRKMEDNRL